MNTASAQPSVRRLNYHYFAMQAGFWAMFAAICGFQVALLLDRGFSNSQIGLVIAVRCVAGILCQPALGGFADRHPLIPLKFITSASLTVSLCAGVVLITVPLGLLGTLAVFFIIGGFEVSAYPLVDSMAIQYINAGIPIGYSLGRGIGSFSYAVVSLLLGFLVRLRGVEITLPVPAVFLVLELVIILTYPSFPAQPRGEDEERPRPRSIAALLRACPDFTLMLAAIFLGISAMVPLSNFLVNIIKSRGGGPTDLGPALFLMAAAELPSAFLFPRLRRLGSAGLISLSLGMIAGKALLLFLSGNLCTVLLVQPVQMLGYGLFLPASVFYANEAVPRADRVLGQSLLMVASNGLGGVCGNLIAGCILDAWGVDAMLWFCVLMGLSGAALALLAGRPGKKDPAGPDGI